MSLVPDSGFKADKQKFGDDLCAAGELFSDQLDMAKAVMRHHFPGINMLDSPGLVMKAQQQIGYLLNGPELFLPINEDALDHDELAGQLP